MNSPTLEELCALGDQHLADKEWKEADNFFQKALSRDVKSKRALLGRAIVLRNDRHDYEQACRFLNRCLFYYPGDPEALAEYGHLHADQGDHEKAVVYFDQTLNHDPTNR